MKVPKKILCEFTTGPDGSHICNVDEHGCGSCGDGVVGGGGKICLWAKEVLEWQDIEPPYLKAQKNETTTT